MRSDVIVMGAGIVGVSIALHLQKRGRDVMLVDRKGAGEETSYGNAGLIERASIAPYAFPRDIGSLLKYGFNTSTEVRYHLSFLPRIAPWLFQYWLHSSPSRHAVATRAMRPLIERCIEAHAELVADAGATPLMRRNGWIKAARTQASLDREIAEAKAYAEYGIAHEILDAAALHAREPHLGEGIIGAVHLTDPATSPDPGGLTKAYADLFARRGGRFLNGDAKTLEAVANGWQIATAEGALTAKEAVIALGPWSNDVFERLGYRMPLAIKRGYHKHYTPDGNAVLNHPVLDVDGGFVLAPMNRGVRLTTGIEFAPRDAPKTPTQLAACEPLAREIFPLGEPVEDEPWMGLRPCFPDMRPVIGPAPRHADLWFAFGHNHHGFTLGPITGRILAQMMTGETPEVEMEWFRADRFGKS